MATKAYKNASFGALNENIFRKQNWNNLFFLLQFYFCENKPNDSMQNR